MHPVLVDQPQVDLVHQGRGLEGVVVALPGHLGARQATQVPVDPVDPTPIQVGQLAQGLGFGLVAPAVEGPADLLRPAKGRFRVDEILLPALDRRQVDQGAGRAVVLEADAGMLDGRSRK